MVFPTHFCFMPQFLGRTLGRLARTCPDMSWFFSNRSIQVKRLRAIFRPHVHSADGSITSRYLYVRSPNTYWKIIAVGFAENDGVPSLPTNVCGLPKLLSWMRNEGVTAFPSCTPETEQQRLLVRFDHHLTNVHGISRNTVHKYLQCAGRFLDALFKNSVLDWTTVTADCVRDFVTSDSQQHNVRDTGSALVATLRF